MAEPSPYSRAYSFTDYQASNPSAPLPGSQVDNELENVEQSLGEAIDAINDVRRSDGALKNGIVTVDSLDATVAAGVGSGALASATAAAASAAAASEDADAAAASVTAAAGSATSASGYATTALGYRNAAAGYADDSAAAASLSQSARDYAALWATEAVGTLVNDGVNTPGYSAYHWAQAAEAAVVGGLSDGAVSTSKIADGAVTSAKLATEVTDAINVVDATALASTIDGAADEDPADTAYVVLRKADGSLIKRGWANLKTLLAGTFALVLNPYTDVAVAGTINIGALTGKPKRLNLTGSAGPVMSFGTGASLGYSARCRVQDGGFSITNSANIVCPGGADIPCAAGDVFDVDYVSADKWVIVNYTKADGAALAGGGGWSSYPVGQIVYVADNITGVEVPPTDQSYRYVKLTAGLTGVGQYNEGCLSSESVSGSAPLVLASASVSLASSPMIGKTVRLLNTEERILRPSTSAGTLQNDALQSHTHTFKTYNGTGASINPHEQGEYAGMTRATSDHSGRSANETRMKNVGVTAYMRIK